MKWDFFYDENDDKQYESIHDWYKEIAYLIVPAIIMIILIATVYICFYTSS